jgi:hypothetical protein
MTSGSVRWISADRELCPGKLIARKVRRHSWYEPASLGPSFDMRNALLSHAVPSGNVDQIFDRALDALIRQLEKRKIGSTSRPGVQRQAYGVSYPGRGVGGRFGNGMAVSAPS